ncbi:MAG TPA: LLM class flavin-dependent oxidoreductase [Acetobacteraceae bacterium]|jgi:alkanesulfonate monooxygenase SsuD/methylene tetrahydromethanopterin reductase-like flavin-dependent oxidoreductase (luciferase family)|nr:LLM class flavin-dependent oxidoreductase [Acetobacteraceae bacterium]
MITKFDSSYAGHVDMENLGYGGTPVNERRYSNEKLATTLTKAVEMAKAMDRAGFNAFWMAEHHFQPEGYEGIPNVLMMAMHLVHVTKRLKIGCGFNITPMWHPLRLAEDYAMADILSEGRVIFGVGRGYHTREVETFGAPLLDQNANRELFEEQVDIIFKAFNEETFSHQGKYYTLPPEVPYRGYTLKELTLVPRPLRRPVECWQPIQSGSQRAFDFMAKHGICGVIGGGSAEGGAVERHMIAFRDAYARVGREIELGERLSLGYQFFIAESREAGIREAAKYYEENMKMFGELRLVRALTEEQIEIMRDPKRAPGAKLPRIEDAVKAGGFLTGTPDDIIEQLKAVEKRYPGLDRVTCSMSIGVPLNVALEQLERFAKEVMPAFKAARTPVAALAQ